MNGRSFLKLVSLLTAMGSGAVFADTITLTSNADSGEGTLRAALTSLANNTETTIEVPEGYVITLESQIQLPSLASFTVKGLGKGATISGGGVTRIFYYKYDRRKDATYRIHRYENLTITGGSADSGGVFLTEQDWRNIRVEFVNCSIHHNEAKYGGAVLCAPGLGDLYFDHCDINTNTVTAEVGDGRYAGGGAVVGVSGNSGNMYSNLTFIACNLIGNSSTGCMPAAIVKGGGTGLGLVSNCVFRENRATRLGSWGDMTGGLIGLCSNGSKARWQIVDSEFFDNVSSFSPGIYGAPLGMAAVTNCHFRGNSSSATLFQFGNNRNGNQDVWGSFHRCLFETNTAVLYSSTSGTGAWVRISSSLLRGNSSATASYVLGSQSGYAEQNLYVRDTMILDCKSSGGGLANGYGAVFENVTFVNNGDGNSSSTQSSSAALNFEDDAVLTNVTFYGNTMNYRGMFGASKQGMSLVNCTVVSNSFGSGYGFFYKAGNCSDNADILNSVFIDNGATRFGPKSENLPKSISHSAVSFAQGQLPSEGANQYELSAANARFVFPPAVNGSWTKLPGGTSPLTLAIAKNSPLRDAGAGTIARDARGWRRDTTPDIGAYEYRLTPFTVIIR